MVDKNSNIVEQFYISFLRLNLGELVVEGLGLFILVLKFGWKFNIFSKKDWHRRKNVFPYSGSNWSYLLGGAKIGGLFSTLFALLLGRIISNYIQCLYFLYLYCCKVGIYSLFVIKNIYCLLNFLYSLNLSDYFL